MKRWLLNWLVVQGAIAEDEKEEIEYAIECTLLLGAPVIMAVALGYFFCPFLYRCLFILPFMVMRKYCGGYHAKKLCQCLAISSALLLFCFADASRIELGMIFHIRVVIASICIWACSPVDSYNRRLSSEEELLFRKICHKWILALAGVYIILICFDLKQEAIFLAYGVILTALLQIPCVISKLYHKLCDGKVLQKK